MKFQPGRSSANRSSAPDSTVRCSSHGSNRLETCQALRTWVMPRIGLQPGESWRIENAVDGETSSNKTSCLSLTSCLGNPCVPPFITCFLRQDPLDLSFWSFLTFLHHGIEEVERHLLWKFYKKKFEGKVGQMCHQSWSLALGFYAKLYTKSAVSESSIALARLNLTF